MIRKIRAWVSVLTPRFIVASFFLALMMLLAALSCAFAYGSKLCDRIAVKIGGLDVV